MPQHRNKKILVFVFLFLLIGTHSNNSLRNFNFFQLNEIKVTGLSEKNNLILMKKLDFIRSNNLFFIDKLKLNEIINSNKLVEKFTVFKKYPSTLNIKITKAQFLANIKKDNNNFLLGSNGKLIKSMETIENKPFIFGKFNNKDFFELKEAIDKTNFNYSRIKNLFFFKSGRWDIETSTGLLIKLPKKDLIKSLKLVANFLEKNQQSNINKIDLRQYNQVIINGN